MHAPGGPEAGIQQHHDGQDGCEDGARGEHGVDPEIVAHSLLLLSCEGRGEGERRERRSEEEVRTGGRSWPRRSLAMVEHAIKSNCC